MIITKRNYIFGQSFGSFRVGKIAYGYQLVETVKGKEGWFTLVTVESLLGAFDDKLLVVLERYQDYALAMRRHDLWVAEAKAGRINYSNAQDLAEVN